LFASNLLTPTAEVTTAHRRSVIDFTWCGGTEAEGQKIHRTEWDGVNAAAYRLHNRSSLDYSRCILIIEKAVLSGEVPVRGVGPLSLVPERIEKQLNMSMHVDVSLSRVLDSKHGKALWYEVEVIWPDCLTYCEANLFPNWVDVPPIDKRTASKTKKRTAPKKTTPKKPPRRRPTRESAQEAINALYANGIIPDHERNKAICRNVGSWLKDNEREPISDDTILRAARRRK
jgi:hypothetical protein